MAVLNVAVRDDSDRSKSAADYLAGKTAGLTAQAITRWLGRQLRSMRRPS